MRCTFVSLAILALALTASTEASAQEGSNHAFGIGAQSMLRGPSGVAATYDVGLVHFDGILYFINTDATADSFGLGARAFYSLHQTSSADFGLGGGVGFIVIDTPGDNENIFNIEFGAKIRAFIVSNVALTAFLGAAIVLDDDNGGADQDGVLLSGQQVGGGSVGVQSGFGFTYYFH